MDQVEIRFDVRCGDGAEPERAGRDFRRRTGYYRDRAIMKMEFRVPCETDMEKVRKIIKKEGRAMFEDPACGENMPAPPNPGGSPTWRIGR